MTNKEKLEKIEMLREEQIDGAVELNPEDFGFKTQDELTWFLTNNEFCRVKKVNTFRKNEEKEYLLKYTEFFICSTIGIGERRLQSKEVLFEIVGDLKEEFDYLISKLKLIKETDDHIIKYPIDFSFVTTSDISGVHNYEEYLKSEYEGYKIEIKTKKLRYEKDLLEKIKNIQEKYIDSKDKLENLEEKIKNQFLTFTGIFIAIFTLITINISIFNDGIKLNNGSKITMLLTVIFGINLSVVYSLYLMMELMRRVKNEKKDKSIFNKSDWMFLIIPIIGLAMFGGCFLYFNNPKETYADKIYKVQNELYKRGKIEVVDGKIGKQTGNAIIDLKKEFEMNETIEITDEFLEKMLGDKK